MKCPPDTTFLALSSDQSNDKMSVAQITEEKSGKDKHSKHSSSVYCIIYGQYTTIYHYSDKVYTIRSHYGHNVT